MMPVPANPVLREHSVKMLCGDVCRGNVYVPQDWDDWKHWCANGMLGQDGHIKKARVRVNIA